MYINLNLRLIIIMINGIKIFNPDHRMKSESPEICHVYNNNKIQSFQNYFPFFYEIYNVSTMKMQKMATKIGGFVRGALLIPLFLKVKLINLMIT